MGISKELKATLNLKWTVYSLLTPWDVTPSQQWFFIIAAELRGSDEQVRAAYWQIINAKAELFNKESDARQHLIWLGNPGNVLTEISCKIPSRKQDISDGDGHQHLLA